MVFYLLEERTSRRISRKTLNGVRGIWVGPVVRLIGRDSAIHRKRTSSV